MENNIQIFNNPQFGEIRISINESNEPLFCLADVCKILCLDPSQVTKRLDDGVCSIHPTTDNLGRIQHANFVNEDGLYDAILDSRKPEAKVFRKWVTSEVLPSIRKHGLYATAETVENMLSDPDFGIKLLTTLKEERTKRVEAEKTIEAQKKKVEFVDRILDTDEKIDIGQAAKILGLPFGRNTLFVKLRELGIFFKNRNEPKQEYIDRGYFELKEKWIDRNEHDGFMVVKVLVTQKGLAFLSKLFNIGPSQERLAKIS